MATVMTVHGDHGGVCYIDDAYYSTLSKEEIEENQRLILETAAEIFERAAERKALAALKKAGEKSE